MNANRKYITSTGILLKTLSEDNQNPIYHQINDNSSSLYNNNHNHIPQYNLSNQPPPNYAPDRYPSKKPQNYYNTNNKNVHHQQPPQMQHQQQQHYMSTAAPTVNYKSAPPSKQASSASAYESSVADLPETFGTPLNRNKKLKYSSSSSQQQQHQNDSNSDIQIVSSKPPVVGESVSAPALSTKQQDNEIEIISETYPLSSTSSSSIVQQNKMKPPSKNLSFNAAATTTANSDEQFKEYLSKHYNMDLSIACKPQCNFVSNISCIDQCIQQTNYYENYLKKQRTFNGNRMKYTSFSSDTADDDSRVDLASKIKKQKLILLDDTEDGGGADDAHKPWITPQLINLIKQRNLLQSKLNEQGKEPDVEMMAKFKNLRNKVTKLVKNARKEYLAKMVKEKKDKEANVQQLETSKSATSVKTTSTDQASAASSSTTQPVSASSSAVSVTTNQSTYMMNLYNTFFNQYMQNYAQQKLPKAAAEEGAATEYDALTQQATFYAQQQQSIQKQLESCLHSATTQFLKDVPTAPTAAQSVAPTAATSMPHIPYNLNYYNVVS